jgi:hypothetical protein
MRGQKFLLGAALIAASGVGGWAAQTGFGTASAGSIATPAGFVTFGPARILDTRNGAMPPGGALLKVDTGLSQASAVSVNITLTETAGPGFVTAWDGSGERPETSVVNSSTRGETIANYVVVPVAADGSFTLFTSVGSHLLVDLMGYFVGGSSPVPSGLTAVVTGYTPLTTSTAISGLVSNGTVNTKDARVDVRCPDGTTARTKEVQGILPGQTRGFEVFCNGLIVAGATVDVVNA